MIETKHAEALTTLSTGWDLMTAKVLPQNPPDASCGSRLRGRRPQQKCCWKIPEILGHRKAVATRVKRLKQSQVVRLTNN